MRIERVVARAFGPFNPTVGSRPMRPDAYAARMIIPAYAIVSFTVACEYRADSSTRARLSSS